MVGASAPDYALPQRQNVRRRRPRQTESPRKRALAEAFPKADLAEEASPPPEPKPAGEAEASPEKGGGPVGGDDALPEHRSLAIKGHKFEYLDHTADVQCHSWGRDLPEAFANSGLAMYNYMTPIKGIEVDESLSRTFEAKGHDMESLLFNFLDELLFVFHTEFFVACSLVVTKLSKEDWSIGARARGGTFSRDVHECGTEVKAITYSAMQIIEREEEAEIFVIVDI